MKWSILMNSQKIIQLGDSRLRKTSTPIDENLFGSNELHNLSELLISLMEKKGGVGLAAPQLGINQRIFALGFEGSERRPKEKAIPITVIINPTITRLTNQKEDDYEACLSIDNGLMAKVPRFKKIAYRGFDPEGNVIEREVEGLHARIIQHEYDHLDGIVFLDRVKDSKTYGFYPELSEAGAI